MPTIATEGTPRPRRLASIEMRHGDRPLGFLLPVPDFRDHPDLDAHRRIVITAFSLLALIAVATMLAHLVSA